MSGPEYRRDGRAVGGSLAVRSVETLRGDEPPRLRLISANPACEPYACLADEGPPRRHRAVDRQGGCEALWGVCRCVLVRTNIRMTECRGCDAGRQRPIQFGTQAARRGRKDGWECRLAAVGPMRSADLRVKVDDRSVSARFDRRDGQMEGERRFPAPSFLADTGDREDSFSASCDHVERVNTRVRSSVTM